MLGEPIALVIATDRDAARDAADRVVVDYEPLPAVIHAEKALEAGAPLRARRGARQPVLHDRAQDRGLRRRLRRGAGRGPPDDRQPAADARADRAARRARELGRAGDELTLYSSTQIPHFLRTFVAVICGIPERAARDRARSRRRLRREAEHLRRGVRDRAGVEARRRARQVDRGRARRRWSRRSTAATSCSTSSSRPTATARVTAIRVKLIQDIGAYLQFLTPSIAHLTVFMVPGAYDIPQLRHHLSRRVHQHDADRRLPRRRPARGDHMIERMMDLLADELGMDPAEVRRRNFITRVPATPRRRA